MVQYTTTQYKDGTELFADPAGCGFIIFLQDSSDSLHQLTILLQKLVSDLLFSSQKIERKH